MRLPSILLISIVGISPAPSVAVTAPVARPTATSDSVPPAGWRLRGAAPQDFIARVDRDVRHSGAASGHLRSKGANPSGFGTLLQTFRGDNFLGRRVRLSAYVRSRDARRAQLWMRIDGPNAILDFDNMDDRPIVGTTEWHQHFIVLDVPPHAMGIAFGVILDGSGEVWIDDLTFEIVGGETPRTAAGEMFEEYSEEDTQRLKTVYASSPVDPRNLAFEDPSS
jgi:hypothetical protein